MLQLGRGPIEAEGSMLRVGLTVVGARADRFPRSSWRLATPEGDLVADSLGGAAQLEDGAGVLDLIFEHSPTEGVYRLILDGEPSWVIRRNGDDVRFEFLGEYEAPPGTPAQALLEARRARFDREARARGGTRVEMPDAPPVGEGADPPASIDEALARIDGLIGDGVEPEVIDLASGHYALVLNGIRTLRASWERLRASRTTTGLWPIVLGDGGELDGEPWDDPRWAGRTIDEILASLIENQRDYYKGPAPKDADFWVEVIPQHRFGYQNRGAYSDIGSVALVPARYGWQAIEVLSWEDGNTLPSWVHRDVIRRWEERWGAELAVIDGAIIELYIPHPVTDRSQAVELAWELHAYGDSVGQNEHLNQTAASLTSSSVWSFWWD